MKRGTPLRIIIKRLKKKLDEAWSLAVRARDGHKCVMCGKTEGLSAHHWIARRARSLATRWLIDNGATLCYCCHLCRLHRESDKEFVDDFFQRMGRIVCSETQGKIIKASHETVDWGEFELRAILEVLEQVREAYDRE